MQLEDKFKESLDKILEKLKEEIIIQGRKTLKKQDIKKIFEKKEDFWEV